MRLVEASGPRRSRPLPCVSPVRRPSEIHRGQPGTRNMAESDTAKARTLYERELDSQPRQTAVRASVMRGASLVCAALLCTAAADARPVKISHKSAATGIYLRMAGRSRRHSGARSQVSAEAAARYRQKPQPRPRGPESLPAAKARLHRRLLLTRSGPPPARAAGSCRSNLSTVRTPAALTRTTDYGALLWDRGAAGRSPCRSCSSERWPSTR